jgi:DNA modification methylase
MTVHRGDCVEVMAGMEPDSVDAIVCDPPYGLEFMGKEWDRLWRTDESPDDTRPGARTRWFGNGGPSPRYEAGSSAQAFHAQWATAALRVAKPGAYLLAFGGTRTVHRMTCALEDAGWVIRDMLVWAYAQGFPKSRASLKPAWEPIVMARKPGASRDLNIDAARIGTEPTASLTSHRRGAQGGHDGWKRPWNQTDEAYTKSEERSGRWPANVILTAPIFDGGWDGVVGGGETFGVSKGTRGNTEHPSSWDKPGHGEAIGYGDTGTYSRFFLIPKAPPRQRVLSDGRRSPHPTQKPEALIRHLVTLVTPEGGLVLDPFLGSGTLGVVCDGLGVRWAGIEREPEYADWAEDRIRDRQPEWTAA